MPAQSGEWIPFDIQPGINRNVEPGDSSNLFVDGDKVRFHDGKVEKFGGWQQELTLQGSLRGVCRRGLPWASLDEVLHLALGTSSQLAIRVGGAFNDITPIKDSGSFSLTNDISTVSGSNVVTLDTTTPHDAKVGDWIAFPSSVTYNGVTLFGEYEIKTVPSANEVTIEASTNASGTGTGGGTVTVDFLLPTGLEDSGASGAGWGVGSWGEGTWGTPRTNPLINDARIWQLQNWGEDLLSLPLGGALYFWDTSVGVGTRAQKVATAPTKNNFMLVANKFRQCILFGTQTILGVFDPLLIRWSDSEDYTNYTPASTNNAGEFRLSRGTRIVSAVESLNGEIIVFTDAAVYKMQPTNTDDVYDIRIVADNIGILAPFACIDVDGVVFFVSQSGWHIYNGVVRSLSSSLDRYYFDTDEDGAYNQSQQVKIHMAYNPQYKEVMTFFPSNTSVEISRYVCYNLKDNLWYDGTMERLWWATNGVVRKPYAMDRQRKLYIHEQGKNDDATPLSAYVQTGFYDISSSNRQMHVDAFTYDGEIKTTCSLSFTSKQYLKSTEATTKTYTHLDTDDLIPIRIKGRYVSMRWENSFFNGDFRFGNLKAHVIPDSLR